MKIPKASLFLFMAWILSQPVTAVAESQPTDPNLGNQAIDSAIRTFLERQIRSLPGSASFTIGAIPNPSLPRQCNSIEISPTPGARPYGRTRVTAKCVDGPRWSMLVPVHIKLVSQYVTIARPIVSGQMLTAEDLLLATGDLGELPDGLIVDASQAVGYTARMNLPAGKPLRADLLKATLVVRSGQNVKVVSGGAGFSVANEGVALNQAATGEVVRVRLPSGQVISGKARGSGDVEVGT